MHRVAVQDANILIDLELAGLLDLWFQAGIATHTTDLIVDQLQRGRHGIALSHLQSGHLVCHSLSMVDLIEVDALMQQVGEGPDLADCSVLWLAGKLGCILLTGDGALRRAGFSQSITVHGTLWILDHLVERALLAERVAAAKIEHLIAAKRRLPSEECENRLAKWRRK